MSTGYLEKLAKNVKEEIQYCSCGCYLGQTGDPSFSGGKRVVVDYGACQECKDRAAEREREVLEAQAIMGRLGLPGSTVHQAGCECGFCRLGGTKQ